MTPDAGTRRAVGLQSLWFALVLGRTMMVGLYGAGLGAALADRHSQLVSALDRLEVLAHRDELTGALNRRSMMKLLREAHERLDRGGRGLALALLDLDHLEHINDQHGHAVGDEVLRQVTVHAAGAMRSSERLGRHGGEEFMLLMSAMSDPTPATQPGRAGLDIRLAC